MNDLSIITLNQIKITNFCRARNQALNKAETDWVLFLDSDEIITSTLKQEIFMAIKDKRYNYQLKRIDYFLGKKLKYGETSKFKSTRLIQKNSGVWQGTVHEVFNSILPVKSLQQPLIHHRNITISQFIDRINFYSNLRAQELKTANFTKLLIYPLLKFIQNFFFRLGFLDSFPGFAMAFLMSLHSLMVQAKLYENKN